MGIMIDGLITFCEEKEYNHRVSCKRNDDASGYTRSKDKNIRTAFAIREEEYGDFYKQIADIMRKYKKIKQILKEPCIIPEGCYPMLKRIKREVEDEKGD